MLYVMLLAHLLGDYLFQTASIARLKARSLLGVFLHGGIVTATTLACACLVDPAWWPYALSIGLTHTVIDVGRARLLTPKNTAMELAWYLLDQAAHVAIIGLVVHWSPAPARAELTGVARTLTDPRVLAGGIGSILLLNPAWVLLRFTVRGVWGAGAAPLLGQGDKYGPMAERLAIAGLVAVGQPYLIPFVLIPRRVVSFQVQGGEVG